MVQAEIRMQFDSQRIENTSYWHAESALEASDLTDLANDLIAWWIANFAGLVADGVQLREVTATDLSTSTSPSVTVAADATFGSGGTNPLPSNVALCVSFRTSSRGRSFRGRNYISGIDRNNLIGPNEFNSGYLTDVVTAYNALVDASSAGMTWGVFSRFHNKVARTAGVFSPILTVLCVDNLVDSMRRRLPGRGT